MPTPEERIAELAPNLLFTPHCRATDPAVQFAIEQIVDPAMRNQLIAVTLETTAAAYRAMADGATKAAQIVSGKANG